MSDDSIVVLDASVIVRACLEAAGFEPFTGLTMVAPALAASETLSAIREAVWRREISIELGALAVDALLEAPISWASAQEPARGAWTISAELGWAKTYAAEYIALARYRGCRLVTLDPRLRRGAGHLVEITGPA